eukprot:4584748-Pleurochrysis_carterae.AAC.2
MLPRRRLEGERCVRQRSAKYPQGASLGLIGAGLGLLRKARARPAGRAHKSCGSASSGCCSTTASCELCLTSSQQ